MLAGRSKSGRRLQPSANLQPAMRFSLRFPPRHAALALIAAAAYLAVASAPCPAVPVPRSSAAHADAWSADGADDGAPSLVAPCQCGCEPRTSGLGGGKRDPGLPPALPQLPQIAHSFGDETPARLPDAPVSVDSPVPISA